MTGDSSRNVSAVEYAGVLGRWLLGGLFLYMGLTKALHPEVFLKQVDLYGIIGSPLLLNSIVATLPWFEVFCGLLLLVGVAVRGSALMLILMLVPFTLIVLQRALAIAGAKGLALCAVKFDCGCGGGEVFACRKIVENCLLLLVAGWLLTGRGRWMALRFDLLADERSDRMASRAPAAPAIVEQEQTKEV